MADVSTAIKCRNCGNAFTGKYCNQCGEKAFNVQEKTIRHIFGEFVHFLTHFEGNIFNTLKTIFTKPGKLSLDYCNGVRKRYYKPTSLYVMVVIAYLIFPLFQGLNLPMKDFENNRWSYPREVIKARMHQRGISYYQLADRYKHKSNTTSKFILLLVLPLCSFALMLLYPKHKLFFDHFMLSIEINTFFIAATFMLLPLAIGLLYTTIPPLRPYIRSDDVNFLIYLLTVGSFCVAAFRRFYGSGTAVSVIKATVFLILHLFIVFYIYRMILFLVVMALI